MQSEVVEPYEVATAINLIERHATNNKAHRNIQVYSLDRDVRLYIKPFASRFLFGVLKVKMPFDASAHPHYRTREYGREKERIRACRLKPFEPFLRIGTDPNLNRTRYPIVMF